jgi:hypothetical protein
VREFCAGGEDILLSGGGRAGETAVRLAQREASANRVAK